jgi:hypothetical protein
MGKKEDAEKVIQIVKDYKSQSNKDLTFALDFMKADFDMFVLRNFDFVFDFDFHERFFF